MSSINLKTSIPGPKSLEIIERRKNAMPLGLAKSTDIAIHSAEGGVVIDVDGNTLLDFAGGIGMMNIGHNNKLVVEAMKEQLYKYTHICSLVATPEPYVELAELLNSLTPGNFPKKTLLANSGSEAVENAVNIARYYTKRSAVICFEGGYHGRTLLTLSLTSKYALFKKGFGPFVNDIVRLPSPNIYRKPDQLTEEEYIQFCINQFEVAMISQIDPDSVAAIIIEPVLGEGGFIPMPKLFLQKLRDVASKHNIVLIFDEIQCGASRTGKLFACEHVDVVPDIICSAKSIGAGMPISAITGRAEILDVVHLGGIGGTYGGNPVSCVAAIQSLKILSSPEFLNRVNRVGELIADELEKWKLKYSCIGDVRGIGAMRLVEFVKDRNTKEPDVEIAMEIIKDAIAHGIILIRAGLFSNCIRLLPPIVMTDEQLLEGLNVLEMAIQSAQLKRN
ncbi:MAG: aspartate aminotransferase family protein [Chitinophagales bacterium]|jgi:4-aminobutyrate aminotransferase/(S)-3-amino-2-methylpropionate transaminase|nr:aspartate aminotransferase family protein [Bacteroidota bacterium]MBP8915919.1 aspartate aminotransferase family protein [Chitinophagales bacterium]MBP9220232.1 aspartate aminotransferase family protein [Chitinophagales bacterium]MBP9794667.1 aspartate aminotransferase family protein [Chitinophagales bacterium]